MAAMAVPPMTGAAGGGVGVSGGVPGRGNVPAGKWTQQVYGWIRDGKHQDVVVALQPVLEVRPQAACSPLPAAAPQPTLRPRAIVRPG